MSRDAECSAYHEWPTQTILRREQKGSHKACTLSRGWVGALVKLLLNYLVPLQCRMSNPRMSNAKMSRRVLIRTVQHFGTFPQCQLMMVYSVRVFQPQRLYTAEGFRELTVRRGSPSLVRLKQNEGFRLCLGVTKDGATVEIPAEGSSLVGFLYLVYQFIASTARPGLKMTQLINCQLFTGVL